MRSIVTAVLALVVAGGLGLSQAKAEAASCQFANDNTATVAANFTAVSYRHRGYHHRGWCRPCYPNYYRHWRHHRHGC